MISLIVLSVGDNFSLLYQSIYSVCVAVLFILSTFWVTSINSLAKWPISFPWPILQLHLQKGLTLATPLYWSFIQSLFLFVCRWLVIVSDLSMLFVITNTNFFKSSNKKFGFCTSKFIFNLKSALSDFYFFCCLSIILCPLNFNCG